MHWKNKTKKKRFIVEMPCKVIIIKYVKMGMDSVNIKYIAYRIVLGKNACKNFHFM